VHQHRIQRVAYRGTLDLGIADHLDCARLVSALIHKQVADANSTGDHRDAAVLAAELVQPRSTARDDQVNVAIHLQQLFHPFTLDIAHHLDRLHGDGTSFQSAADSCCQRAIGLDGLAPTAQHSAVA